MKYKYVFLLGRPASGKSALFRELQQQLLSEGKSQTLERRDDVHKVWSRLHRDDALEAAGQERLCSRRLGAGDYELTDHNMLNEILQEVSAEALQSEEPHRLTVFEFSRPDYVGALQNFDNAILENCLVIYLHVSFDTSCARNAQRKPVTGKSIGDDHWVPDRTMETIYRHDDRDALVQYLAERGIPFVVIDNDADDLHGLRQQVARLLETHFAS